MMLKVEPESGCRMPSSDHWQVQATGTSMKYTDISPVQAEEGPVIISTGPGGGGGGRVSTRGLKIPGEKQKALPGRYIIILRNTVSRRMRIGLI
jgi:hypothetical protein